MSYFSLVLSQQIFFIHSGRVSFSLCFASRHSVLRVIKIIFTFLQFTNDTLGTVVVL